MSFLGFLFANSGEAWNCPQAWWGEGSSKKSLLPLGKVPGKG